MSLLAGIERHKAKTTAYSTDKHATNPARRRIPARCAILAVNAPAEPNEHMGTALVSQPGSGTSEEKRERRTGMNIMKYTETKKADLRKASASTTRLV